MHNKELKKRSWIIIWFICTGLLYGQTQIIPESMQFRISSKADNYPIFQTPYSADEYRNIGLQYSTFFGGSLQQTAKWIDVDTNGNIYVFGITFSDDIKTTAGAYDPSHNGGWDTFIAKFASNGSLVYSTYLGSPDEDFALYLEVQSNGSVLVVGSTRSSSFPTTANAYNQTHGAGMDIFISLIDATGSSLLYSTFLGGNGEDTPYGVARDDENNLYITGGTYSPDFPTTIGVYNQTHNSLGNSDGFLAKMNPDATELIYATYFGGIHIDIANALTIDSDSNPIITGITASSNFPVTEDALQGEFGTNGDCFLMKFNSLGSELLYSSYIGGVDSDTGKSITLDSDGNIIIGGTTFSSGFPLTIDAYDSSPNGVADGFVMKFTPDFDLLLFSTVIGGSSSDIINHITVDADNNIYIAGQTGSLDFPTTELFEQTYSGSADIFLGKLSENGANLDYSIILGGDDIEELIKIHIDSKGQIYAVGVSSSSNFPTTVNAYNQTLWGQNDAIILQFQINPDITTPSDIEYEYGTEGNTIVWTIMEAMVNNPYYVLFQNSKPIATEEWNSGIPIIIVVDGLNLGISTYEIKAYNGIGGYINDTVIVSVSNLPPTIISPSDLDFEEGTKDYILNWIIIDESVKNPIYRLYRNDFLLETNTWKSEIPISVVTGDLAQGHYEYVLIAEDGLGSSISNTIDVQVLPAENNVVEYLNNHIWEIILVCFLLGVLLMVSLQQRKLSKMQKLISELSEAPKKKEIQIEQKKFENKKQT